MKQSRVDITRWFDYTEQEPKVVSIEGTTWSMYRDQESGHIIVESDNPDLQKYDFNLREGTVFLMKEYCYFRYQAFQLLLDSLRIDKVCKVTEESVSLSLIAGTKSLSKSFTVYTDGDTNIKETHDINSEEEFSTKMFIVTVSNAKWLIVDTKNTRFKYRTFYCWDDSPTNVLRALIKDGKPLKPVIAS